MGEKTPSKSDCSDEQSFHRFYLFCTVPKLIKLVFAMGCLVHWSIQRCFEFQINDAHTYIFMTLSSIKGEEWIQHLCSFPKNVYFFLRNFPYRKLLVWGGKAIKRSLRVMLALPPMDASLRYWYNVASPPLSFDHLLKPLWPTRGW